MNLRQAERKLARIKMGLLGPSGSGKTLGALKIAHGLTGDWAKIALIDTENHSADLYSHLGNFNVLGLGVPFTPERYNEAISLCEKAGMEVIIIDSISHEWEGEGGILMVHSSMTGNSFTNWNKITPRHNGFVQKMLQSPCHIIATIRSKQDYVINESPDGKMIPQKVGLRGVTRTNMDYEFTLVLDLDIKHNATASKDRTGLFMDKAPFIISTETGKTINKWCHFEDDVDAIITTIEGATNVEQLKQILNEYPHLRPLIEEAVYKRHKELHPVSIVN